MTIQSATVRVVPGRTVTLTTPEGAPLTTPEGAPLVPFPTSFGQATVTLASTGATVKVVSIFEGEPDG